MRKTSLNPFFKAPVILTPSVSRDKVKLSRIKDILF